MRIQIVVTDDQGRTYDGQFVLEPRPAKKSMAKADETASSKEPKPLSSRQIDFALPARAFVRKNGAQRMTGPQKFVLLVSWIAKGKTNAPVDIKRVRNEWGRMTEPMGGDFNAAYSTRAGDNGWVESPKKGRYQLRPTWTEILSR